MKRAKKNLSPTIRILEGDEVWSYKAPIVNDGIYVRGYSPSMQKKMDMMAKIKLPKFTRVEKPDDQA